MTTNTSAETASHELSIERVLNAPRELVWKVWTDPVHCAAWWGPDGFTTTMQKMELVPGGNWDLIMHGPDGTDYINHSIFTEIRQPERLAYKHISRPVFEAFVDFIEEGAQTRIRMRMLFDTAEERTYAIKTFGADKGLVQHAGNLISYLEKVKS